MAMPQLKRNIVANFVGNAWAATLALAFIPIYIHFMGIEAYGLVGFFATLQAIFSVLDLGLGTAINREMARFSVQPDRAQEMRNLVRTLEVIYWSIALLIGVFVIAAAPLIAGHWLQMNELPIETARQAIELMGLAIACRWPFAFYSGGLMGLQRQVLLNIVRAVLETLRHGGTVLLLWLLSPTIQAFFIWQIVVGVLSTFAVAWLLWHSLPPSKKAPRLEVTAFQRVWRFAAGMSAISVLTIILMQMDKIILSRLLSLGMFGYYALASAVAVGLYQIISPVFSAYYPRFTQLVTLNDEEGLKQAYHRGCQLIAVLMTPAAIIVALFSREILLLWTQNPVTADNTHAILSLLIIGSAINGLMNLPYALQLAYGWTKLAFYSNVLAVILLVPLIFVMTWRYGAIGAAAVWVLLNCGYLIFSIQFMHRRLIRSEKSAWYIDDVLKPVLATLLVALPAFWCFRPSGGASLSSIVSLASIAILTYIAAAFSTFHTRQWLLSMVGIPKKLATD